ncbi:MAG: hypothetical protein JXA95_16930 [Spirochaetales bacterium]|nr:hypothetical protein [Spirochaetales bacterium]
MRFKNIFLATFSYFFILSLSGQSNEIIDKVLSQEKLTCGYGAYLTLNAAGYVGDEATPEEALSLLQDMGWMKKSKAADDFMSLGEYSLALMQGFSLKGGIMYSLFPAPRYASRELGFKGYIARDSGAYRSLTGNEAISMLSQIIRHEGG